MRDYSVVPQFEFLFAISAAGRKAAIASNSTENARPRPGTRQSFVRPPDPAGSASLSSSRLPVSDHPKIHSADQLGSVRLGGFHGGRSLLQSTRV
jgi:hypothetical protein